MTHPKIETYVDTWKEFLESSCGVGLGCPASILIHNTYLQRRCKIPTRSGAPVWRLGGKLALDESESLRAVLVDVLLVGVGIVAVAAVGVGRVAVRLDDACVGGRALEASRAGSELRSYISDGTKM